MNKKITRIWHGITKATDAEAYLAYLEKTGVDDYKKTPGNLGVQILRRIEGNLCHFWTMTQWDSYESIKGFAGPEYEKARYYGKIKTIYYRLSQRLFIAKHLNFRKHYHPHQPSRSARRQTTSPTHEAMPPVGFVSLAAINESINIGYAFNVKYEDTVLFYTFFLFDLLGLVPTTKEGI